MRQVLLSIMISGLLAAACDFEVNAPVDVDTEGSGGRASSTGPTDPGTGAGSGAGPNNDAPEWTRQCEQNRGEGGSGNSGFGAGDLTVLVLFDKSGSMASPWEGQTRWEAANAAFLRGLEGVESEVTVGAITFPSEHECDVAPHDDSRQITFQIGESFVERWRETVETEQPVGGTPLGLAFRRADEAIQQAEECGLLEGRRFRVVVVTDGEPNCGTNEHELVAYAESWRDKGVEVHVLGLPGSHYAARLLDRIAGVGGTDEHVASETVEDAEDHFWHVVR